MTKQFIAPGLTQFQQELAEAAKAYYQCVSFDNYVEVERDWRMLLEQAQRRIIEEYKWPVEDIISKRVKRY